MPLIIKLDQSGTPALVEDHWHLVQEAMPTPENAACIQPLTRWQESAHSSSANGVWISGGDDTATLFDNGSPPPLIAIHFPRLADGRGFSTARLLRGRHHFTSELRAIGYFMADQLLFLKRCGFDAFAPAERNETELSDWLARFADLRSAYQGGQDELSPLLHQQRAET